MSGEQENVSVGTDKLALGATTAELVGGWCDYPLLLEWRR